MKLRTKVFLIFATVAIIPLLILTIFSYSRYTQTTYQRMDEISSNLFANATSETNDLLETIKQITGIFTFYSDSEYSVIENLKQFSDPNEVYNNYDVYLSNQNVKFVCQNMLYSYNFIYGVYVFTPAGAVLGYRGQNGDIPLHYVAEPQIWYQNAVALNGKIGISSVADHDLFTGKKESLFFSQALYDIYSHEFLGVLVLDCNPNLFNLSNVNTMPEQTILTISDFAADNVLYTNIDDVTFDYTSPECKEMEQPLQMEQLKLTAVFDYGSLFREYNITGVLLVLIGIVLVVGIAVLALILSKYLVHPIEHLSRKMARQDRRNLTISNRYVNRTDEIGTLYNEYNAMIEELNTSIKRDYQDKLIILDAQMKSLEARINSHFLFNTLESINSMAELDDNEQIATMSLALGNMFRYTIKTQSELVTVEEELNHVYDYVAIQQIRFSNRFDLDVQIPKGLQTTKVLKLILQPLVENSLFHGLKYCNCGTKITLRGLIEGSNFCLYVEDDGQGMTPAELDEITNKLAQEATFTEMGHRNKESIGLKNIHTRIELYYGRGYGLTIQSKLDKGTSIEIKLPILQKENV